MTPDELLAQMTPQIRQLAQSEANKATVRAVAEIQAAKKEAIASAKGAVISAGVIGGVIGGLIGFFAARRLAR